VIVNNSTNINNTNNYLSSKIFEQNTTTYDVENPDPGLELA
jgi:hypothetical protein